MKFELWDTAGQERLEWTQLLTATYVPTTCNFRFRGSILPMYYRGANAAIIVYDVTSQSSFERVSEWITGRHDT